MPRDTKHDGFWGHVEALFLDLQHDPEKSARALRAVWWLSVAFIAFGMGVIAYTLLLDGSWPPF